MTASAIIDERAAASQNTDRLVAGAAFAIVLIAMTFNMALCFVNTKTGTIGTGHVIAGEIVIVFATLALAYPSIGHLGVFVLSAVILYLLVLASIRTLGYGEPMQVKPVRDLIIPIAFFSLGMRAGNVRVGDMLVRFTAALVLCVGLVELLYPDQFTKVFDIANFYVNRGAMVSDQAQLSSNLFISGMRPEELGGRNLLPFLGPHRMSSIFLEPVTAGNFGVLVVTWALVRSLAEGKPFWGMLSAGAAVIVLADSRFGAMFCLVALGLALLPTFFSTIVATTLPAIALAGIFVAQAQLSISHAAGNGFVSRLLLSATFLENLSIANLFGIQSPTFTPYDSGYAYLFCGAGIIGALGLWLALWSLESRSRSFNVFRNQIAAYYAALLCISNSAFTIKFASLLWFLAAVLYASETGNGLRVRCSEADL